MDWRDYLTDPFAWFCALPAMLGFLLLIEITVVFVGAERHMGTVVTRADEQIYIGLPSTWRLNGFGRRGSMTDYNGELVVQAPTVDERRRRLELEVGFGLFEPDMHETVPILWHPSIPGRAYLARPINLLGPTLVLFLASIGMFIGLAKAKRTKSYDYP